MCSFDGYRAGRIGIIQKEKAAHEKEHTDPVTGKVIAVLRKPLAPAVRKICFGE